MDGNADLLKPLMEALPSEPRKSLQYYVTDAVVTYDQWLGMLDAVVPKIPYLLVAESYATPLAIRFAASHPPHLQGLVLCAGFAASPLRGWRRHAAQIASPLLFRLPPSRLILERFLIGEGAEPALLNQLQASIAAVKPQVFAARLREVLHCDVRSDLAKIAVPTLYLQARNDRLVGPTSLSEILAIKPDIAVEQIPGPHLLFQREPVEAAAAIDRFVQQRIHRGGEPQALEALSSAEPGPLVRILSDYDPHTEQDP
jgi:pimeloyl-ACP methyl ester carboxylesterase